MANPATHPADPTPSRPEARRGVISGLLAFGMRLASALKEKAKALGAAGQDTPDLSVPLARVNQLICRILAFSARLWAQANADERPGAEPRAAEPIVRPESERLREYEDLFEDLREFEFESEDEEEDDFFDDLFADLREDREYRFEKPRNLWTDLPFDETVARFWEELQDIAGALGDHPLVRQAQAAAAQAKALCPPPIQSPPPPAAGRSGPDGPSDLRLQLVAPRPNPPSPPDPRGLRLRQPIRRKIGSIG